MITKWIILIFATSIISRCTTYPFGYESDCDEIDNCIGYSDRCSDTECDSDNCHSDSCCSSCENTCCSRCEKSRACTCNTNCRRRTCHNRNCCPPRPIPPTPSPPTASPCRFVSTPEPSPDNKDYRQNSSVVIENTITSENHINIPINITLNNENNIVITSRDERTDVIKNGSDRCPNCIPPIKIPIPYYVTIPERRPVHHGCCQVVQPCTPYSYSGCRMTSHQCSSSCLDSYMYNPINVCEGGCYRNQISMGHQCSSGGCYQDTIDCSRCDEHFYQSYENFMMCSGCFRPSQWGSY
ncbi:uncharacterized protein LOC115891084 [Sitophilus oryzae]|uniref:Uncharacterized protein LOC115891084 n=1 Tax=Sitophilus oryzae TaxID=7048 RepID=A0A6J2YTB6_SITOR|nr:uncharacterized protein LOC115891084 [Sitophilus oryzae]